LAVVVALVWGLVPGTVEAQTGAPTRLRAVPGHRMVTLSWAAPDDATGVTAYRVYRDGARVAQVADPTALVVVDRGLTNGRTHRYRVSAVRDGAEGPRSAPVTVTVGARPEDPPPAPADAEGVTEARVYRYSIATRGSISADLNHFAIHVAMTLNDPRGWSLGGSIEFRRVASGGDFTVWLAEASTLPSFGYPCHPMWSCRVGRNVIINQTRWQQASPSWNAAGGSRDSYRHYVVNHETGHWLGFGHSGCPGSGQAAPVMQQQSIALNGCRHNTWPVPGERSAAGSRHGVGVRPIGPDTAHFRFGQQGDRVLACDWNGDGRDTPGVVRGTQWRLRNRNSSGGPQIVFTYGQAGDRFVCGDWNGDGTDTPGVVRGNEWRIRNRNSAGAPAQVFNFGGVGHAPVVGDWNGDGIDTAGMVDGNRWAIRNRNTTGAPFRRFTFGRANDKAVTGDWDGDGDTDPGMVRGQPWLFRRSLTSGPPHIRVVFGNRGVPPVVGRWDGLAIDKPGRTLNGNWHLRRFSPLP
jgi:hypothetical protein